MATMLLSVHRFFLSSTQSLFVSFAAVCTAGPAYGLFLSVCVYVHGFDIKGEMAGRGAKRPSHRNPTFVVCTF